MSRRPSLKKYGTVAIAISTSLGLCPFKYCRNCGSEIYEQCALGDVEVPTDVENVVECILITNTQILSFWKMARRGIQKDLVGICIIEDFYKSFV